MSGLWTPSGGEPEPPGGPLVRPRGRWSAVGARTGAQRGGDRRAPRAPRPPRRHARRRRDRQPRARDLAARARPPRRRDTPRRAGAPTRRPIWPRPAWPSTRWRRSSTGSAPASASTRSCSATPSVRRRCSSSRSRTRRRTGRGSAAAESRRRVRRRRDRGGFPTAELTGDDLELDGRADGDRAGAVGDARRVERIVGPVGGARVCRGRAGRRTG